MVHAPRSDQRTSRRWLPHALLSSGIALLLLASVPTLVRIGSVKRGNAPEKTRVNYTFVGDDYPQYYPLDLANVPYAPEDTVHYQVFSEEAEREWDSIFPEGEGFLHLGPDRRTFGLSIFHQMHCLVKIRHAISTNKASGHAHHCINYLRQVVLCEADSTLEPALSAAADEVLRMESSRTCRDWRKVYEMAADNSRSANAGIERTLTGRM